MKEYISLGLKAKGDEIEFIASDETKDRHGDVISLDSWDLANFLKAPRMLVDHWHSVSNIVGKWANVRIDKSADSPGLKMKAIFHNITKLSRETSEMVKKGFLNTVSVGFIPHMDKEIGPDGEDVGIPRNELIEVSLVTVPANPNAEQIKSLLITEEKRDENEEKEIVKFLDVDNSAKNDEKTEVKDKKEDMSIEKTEKKADEVKIEINSKEKQKEDTPANIGQSKGRRLSIQEKQVLIARKALKESAKAINFALNKLNKK